MWDAAHQCRKETHSHSKSCWSRFIKSGGFFSATSCAGIDQHSCSPCAHLSVPFALRLRRLILQHIFVHRCTWTLPPHHFTPAHVKNYCTAQSECLQKIKGWNTAVRCTLQRLYWCVPAMLRMQSYLRNEMLARDWQNEIHVSFLKECIVGFVGKKKVLCPSKTFYWQSWYTILLGAQEQSKLTGFTVLEGHELCTVYDIQSNQSQLQINWSAARMRAILISYSIKQRVGSV